MTKPMCYKQEDLEHCTVLYNIPYFPMQKSMNGTQYVYLLIFSSIYRICTVVCFWPPSILPGRIGCGEEIATVPKGTVQDTREKLSRHPVRICRNETSQVMRWKLCAFLNS